MDQILNAQTRRRIATLSALFLVTATLVVVSETRQATPALAATSSVFTGIDRADLAEAIGGSRFPSGSATVVVAQDSADAVHLAGNYATWNELPIVVASSGTSASGVLTEITSYDPDGVVLISSSAGYFTSAFVSDLSGAAIAVDETFDSADLFTRWADAGGTSQDVYALARSDNPVALRLATSYAASLGVPLIVWESTTSPSLMSDFFDSTPSANLVFFGLDVVPSDLLSADRIDTLTLVPLDDEKRASIWIASQAQLYGGDSSRIVAAPSDRLDELALAGVAAVSTSSIVLPAGAVTSITTGSRATEYLSLWESEASDVTLVGTGVTGTHLTALLAPTTGSPAAAPAFRTTGLVRSATDYTLTFTTVAGATSYKFYDPMGTLIASSATPSLTFTTLAGGILAVAEGPSGELERVDVHLNSIDLGEDSDTIIMVGADGGTNHISILSDIATPRLVTRSVADVFGEFPDPTGHEPIAITCATEFTDVTGDPMKEYSYSVIDLTNVSVEVCDPSSPLVAADAEALIVATVTAPPTEFPWLRGTEMPRSSGVTFAQSRINEAIDESLELDSSSARGPGDDWPPIITRWIAYIPELSIVGPGVSGDINRPILMFGGDNHGTDQPNESVRFRQDVTFTFGSTSSRTYVEHMGATHRYHCVLPYLYCVLHSTATASYSELNATSLTGGATWGKATLRASATNPLLSYAPAIDTQVYITLAAGRSVVSGYHDNMPKHEFYTGMPLSWFYKIYESPYNGYATQVHCLTSSPDGFQFPGCAIYFNALI